jgi:hypothetical protein
MLLLLLFSFLFLSVIFFLYDLAPCDFFLFPKMRLKGRRFDTIEEIQTESQRVPDTLTEKDFQEAFRKWRRRWDRCQHAGGNYLRVMAADRPYGEFYDFYSVSPEYSVYTLAFTSIYIHSHTGHKVARMC